MNRYAALAAVAAAAAIRLAPPVASAEAPPVSASIDGDVATLNLDGTDDTETVSVEQGLLVHSALGGGLKGTADWDSTADGEQTVPADGSHIVVINGGGGNDTISVQASLDDIIFAELNGDEGDDTLTDADTGDALDGGDGNDRLVGRGGADDMTGGAGDDTFVWNNGDSSDSIDGGADDDTVEVNGSPALGDTLTLAPDNGVVLFKRRNLTTFVLRTAAEHFQVNGLGGDDSVTASAGVGALTQLSVDGGSGADVLSGSDGPDLLAGGSGNDRIDPGAGSDVVLGGGGDDQVDARDGESDFASGGDGTDSVIADAADVDLIDGFESVDRPAQAAVDPPPVPVQPPPAPPAGAQPPPAAPLASRSAAPIVINTRTVKLSGNTAALRISCPARSPADCTGVLVLRTTTGSKLGRARYDLAPGASATVKLRLARDIRRLAGRKGRLKAVAVASASGNVAQSSRSVTLVIRKSPRTR